MSERSADPGPTVAELGEFGLIDRLARILNQGSRDPLRPEVTGALGIGDDAALWEPGPGVREVLTTDALIEDVHFRHSTTSWHDLGWKALAENVSDIAAMGARPARAFVTLGLRPDTRVGDLEDLYRGFDAFIREGLDSGFSLVIAGGDTVSSPVTMLSITVVGELHGEGLRRAAGLDGDLLAVTGALGGSAGGLAILEQGDAPFGNPDVGNLISTHRRPYPRVLEGLALVDAGVRCGMDLSDGLLGDAGKLAYASGLSAIVDLHCLPMSPSLWRHFGGDTARMMALAGGEDYELLVAGSMDAIERAAALLDEYRLERPGTGHLVPLTVVGRLVAGSHGQVTVLDEHGQQVAPPKGSWDHFRSGGHRIVTYSLVVRSTSAEQTRRIGHALGTAAEPGDVLLLEGAFGVGKTVLVQGLAAGLGVQGAVTSPSFVLMVQHQGRLPLFHVDLYRLDGRLDDEMLDTLADAEDVGGVCAIEWPGVLPTDLRAETTTIRFTALDDETREIAIDAPSERLPAAAQSAIEAA